MAVAVDDEEAARGTVKEAVALESGVDDGSTTEIAAVVDGDAIEAGEFVGGGDAAGGRAGVVCPGATTVVVASVAVGVAAEAGEFVDFGDSAGGKAGVVGPGATTIAVASVAAGLAARYFASGCAAVDAAAVVTAEAEDVEPQMYPMALAQIGD
jgi:hypothetical protein